MAFKLEFEENVNMWEWKLERSKCRNHQHVESCWYLYINTWGPQKDSWNIFLWLHFILNIFHRNEVWFRLHFVFVWKLSWWMSSVGVFFHITWTWTVEMSLLSLTICVSRYKRLCGCISLQKFLVFVGVRTCSPEGWKGKRDEGRKRSGNRTEKQLKGTPDLNSNAKQLCIICI